jgi:hypothetical protein
MHDMGWDGEGDGDVRGCRMGMKLKDAMSCGIE